jgi:hypothetical protein
VPQKKWCALNNNGTLPSQLSSSLGKQDGHARELKNWVPPTAASSSSANVGCGHRAAIMNGCLLSRSYAAAANVRNWCKADAPAPRPLLAVSRSSAFGRRDWKTDVGFGELLRMN